MKDDRASASENQVCMGFFFPSQLSNSQKVRYSARQKSRSASGGDVAVGKPGARLQAVSLEVDAFQFGIL